MLEMSKEKIVEIAVSKAIEGIKRTSKVVGMNVYDDSEDFEYAKEALVEMTGDESYYEASIEDDLVYETGISIGEAAKANGWREY